MNDGFEKKMANLTSFILVATVVGYIVVFGFIGWVVVKALQHFGII